jgi:8-oxo-dGTP pyrophosphatase MutT (NUDIX family)
LSAIATNKPTRIIAKTAVFNSGGKILVLTRSNTDRRRPGGLDFPGGKIDPGEDILAGAVREIQEEAGFSIDPNDLTVLFANTSAPDDEGVVVTRIFCAVNVDNPEITLSFEHSDYTWVSLQEVLDTFGALSWAQGLEFALKHNLIQK